MGQNDENAVEVRRLRRLLKEIGDLAQSASLTGSLSKGAPAAVRRYNQVVTRLEALGVASGGLFQPLNEESTFDELGVESTLLASYLEEEAPAGPFAGHQTVNGPLFDSLHVGNLGSLEGLKDIGRIIREQMEMNQALRQRESAAGEATAGGPPPSPPEPHHAGAEPGAPEAVPEPMPDLRPV